MVSVHRVTSTICLDLLSRPKTFRSRQIKSPGRPDPILPSSRDYAMVDGRAATRLKSTLRVPCARTSNNVTAPWEVMTGFEVVSLRPLRLSYPNPLQLLTHWRQQHPSFAYPTVADHQCGQIGCCPQLPGTRTHAGTFFQRRHQASLGVG
jgi:hypothetical protein